MRAQLSCSSSTLYSSPPDACVRCWHCGTCCCCAGSALAARTARPRADTRDRGSTIARASGHVPGVTIGGFEVAESLRRPVPTVPTWPRPDVEDPGDVRVWRQGYDPGRGRLQISRLTDVGVSSAGKQPSAQQHMRDADVQFVSFLQCVRKAACMQTLPLCCVRRC